MRESTPEENFFFFPVGVVVNWVSCEEEMVHCVCSFLYREQIYENFLPS
jgi:hypothetical protein